MDKAPSPPQLSHVYLSTFFRFLCYSTMINGQIHVWKRSNKLRSHKELIVKLKSKIILGPLCKFLYVLSESYPESSFKRYFFLRNSWSRYLYSICPNWTLKIKSADTRQRQGFAISLVLREQISGSSTSAVTSSMPLAHRCLSTNPMEARVGQ